MGVCNWGESTIGKVCYGGRDRWRRHTSGSDIKGSTGEGNTRVEGETARGDIQVDLTERNPQEGSTRVTQAG